MSKDLSWTEAACKVLEESSELWLTAPEVIKEIHRTQIKRFHCSFGQARRSLRSSLIFHSRKENGLVARNEGETRITYALRKRLRSRAPHSLPTELREEPYLLNGSIESPPPCPTPRTPLLSSSECPFAVEIDPTPSKSARGQRCLAGFCLPSPLHSILGPKRTLHVLQESVGNSSHRPVRKVRKKSTSKPEEEPGGLPSRPPSPLPPPPSFLGLEEHSSVQALLADVAFVRTELEGDPSAVQGARDRVAHQEISLGPPVPSESSNSEEEEESEEESETTESEPGQQLLVGRSPLTQLMSVTSSPRATTSLSRLQQGSLPTPRPSPTRPRLLEPPKKPEGKLRPPGELRRSELAKVLFTPTSPLATDNIKALLNHVALEGLPHPQMQALVNLLPPADQQDRERVSGSCFTNTFFSTAVREWQEQLAVGAFTPEYRSRARQEERRKCSLRTDDLWKQRYYEEYWGDRSEEQQDSPPAPYYPIAELPPLHQACLLAVKEGCGRTGPPSPPPPRLPIMAVVPPKKHRPNPPIKASCKAPIRVPTACKVLKTVTKPASKPAHKPATKSAVGKKVAVKRLLQVNKPLLKRHNMSCYLSPVPPSLPHHSLLVALVQASRTPHPSLPPSRPYTAPPPHSHPVFQDHFSILSAEHVPEEFSAPVKSLPVQLPRELFSRCLQSKAASRDHNYAGSPFRHKQSLKLSVPRSLLTSVCVCDGEPLVQCSYCHSLYHASCSRLCPTCSHL